jgi:hypothetical protein
MNALVPTGEPAVRRTPLIVAGALLVGGTVANTIVTTFHPHQADPNNHPAVFAEYAASSDWIAVHYAQYAAALTMLAGFVVLYRALTLTRQPSALDHVAVGAAITSAAAVTALQAIDGVALKHAADAWATAPESDKAVRFAVTESVRWLEWGANSYFYTMVGLTLVLYGATMVRGGLVPRWLGWTGLVAGVAFVVTAVPVGYRGFEATPSALIAVALFAVTAVGIIIAGVRTPKTTPTEGHHVPAAPAYASDR